MKIVEQLVDLRCALEGARGLGPVVFVPTMGSLHEGHLSLVRAGLAAGGRVVVSIFVNPLQFGAGEDLASYPRDLQRDAQMLDAVGAGVLFAPPVGVMYPGPQSAQTRVEVPGLSDILCGRSRPGHFVGVATVVCKLFNMVQPDIAVFGKKDYQQLMVIRRMVQDLAMPVRLLGTETLREPDGLAMSSRNAYLAPHERAKAPVLYRVLCETGEALHGEGLDDWAGLEARARRRLADAGLRVDYVAIRRSTDLAEPDREDADLVILAAAFLGKTRLIDNLEVVLGTQATGSRGEL